MASSRDAFFASSGSLGIRHKSKVIIQEQTAKAVTGILILADFAGSGAEA